MAVLDSSAAADLSGFLREAFTAIRGAGSSQFAYRHGAEAVLVLVAFAMFAVLLLALRAAVPVTSRRAITVPAVLGRSSRSRFAPIRHLPVVLATGGLAFFILALADPSRSVVQRERIVVGQRIALVIDGSASMGLRYPAPALTGITSPSSAHVAAVAAAKQLVERRARSGSEDFLAIVEFSDEPYVITPFTNDYDTLQLSLSLMGDEAEYARFPSRGTVIGNAIRRTVELFRSFDFLEASGNLMVVFSDGRDLRARDGAAAAHAVMESAIRFGVPVWFVRTVHSKPMGGGDGDELWQAAVERTGGRFYAAADEATLIRALDDIDSRAAATTRVKQHASAEPQFAGFALTALALWTLAVVLKLAVPQFSKFP